MLLISNGIYRILEPKINKCFRIWTVIIGIIGIILLLITHFHALSFLFIPAAVAIVFLSLTSGHSKEYDLRERKIYYKETVKFRYAGSHHPTVFEAPDRELEIYFIVSALYGFRFEQTSFEKKRDIGRIYFCGTTRFEADRPLTAYEKRSVPTPHCYELYGVENFERITTTLKELLPPEKFLVKESTPTKTQ